MRAFYRATCGSSAGRVFFAAVVSAVSALGVGERARAQLDYGSWNATGTGTYLNGDTVTVNLGPNTLFGANTFSTNAVGAPFDQPGAGQYSHFANNFATPSWNVTVDLSNYHVTPQTVIAFANLGAGVNSGTQTASLVFRDGASSPLPLTGATFLGSFAHQWNAQTFDDPASFNLSTGIWSYTGNGQNVEGASAIFFLTNLPAGASRLEFTVSNPTNAPNYTQDSVFFAIGTPIPEPSTVALTLPLFAFLFRRVRNALPPS